MSTTPATGAVHPTLFIGLGGTGKEVLLRLRRKFYEKWRVPGLPCMAYVWIDTDTRDSVNALGEKLDETELELKFEVDEVVELLKGTVDEDLGDVLRNKNRYSFIHDWLHPEVERFGVDIANGAGSVRSVGRLAFFSKYSRIQQRLERSINRITAQPSIVETETNYLPGVEFDPTPVAYLIFSVAGGTGGGTFLDVSFLLKDLKLVSRTTGIVVLPNVYHDTPHTEEGARSHGNAYSALMELEHFSRRVRPPRVQGDDAGVSIDFDVDWTDQGVKPVLGPPFNSLYLCEMRNEQGQGAGSRAELFHMLAHSLFIEFIPGQFSTAKRGRLANIFQHIASVEDDALDIGDAKLLQTFSRRYSSFGMSKIEIPLESIREACSCKLAAELIRYWDRPSEETELKGRLARDGHGHFDSQGLEGLFGVQWKATIDAAIAKTLPEALPPNLGDSPTPLEKFIDALPARFQELHEQMLARSGRDQLEWGRVPAMLANGRAEAQKELRNKLRTWVADCLGKSELGLNALLGEAHLIAQLRDQFQKMYKPTPNEATRRKERADAQAAVHKQRRDAAASELKQASRSPLIGALGLRTWTVEEMYRRVRDEATQQAKAVAAAYVAEEGGALAKSGDDFLDKMKVSLEAFKDRLPKMAAGFENLRQSFLDFRQTYLSIRLFDEAEDFPHFYLLDFDEQAGKHLPVGPAAEQRKFLERQLGAGKGLLDLIEAAAREQEDWLRSKVRLYAVDRFQTDFDTCRQDRNRHKDCGRFLDVLNHTGFKTGTDDKIRHFVRSAMPMLNRAKGFRGVERETKQAYLGLPNPDGAAYKDFTDRVKKLLGAEGYKIDEPFSTNEPTSIQLFVERNAFPLSSVDLVVGHCHSAYYNFYHGERGTPKETRYHIPLHLCRTWEGEFEDLKPLDERMAEPTKEALAVLTVGPILGVIRLTDNKGRREHAYRRWVPPSPKTEALGNKRQSCEWLLKNEKLRARLLEHIYAREQQLKHDPAMSGALLPYFWALAYLNYKMFPKTSPEHSVVEARLLDLGHFLAKANIKYDELTDLEQSQQAERSKAQLAGTVDWVLDFPILKAFAPAVLDKPGELHAAV